MADQCDSPSRRQCDVQIATLTVQMANVSKDVAEVKSTLEKYVTQHEFSPVKLIVYGMAGLILAAVVGAMIALVVAK